LAKRRLPWYPQIMAVARKALKRRWEVWRDASGRLSMLRIGTLALLLVPVAIATYDYLTVGFGPRPINDVIHRTGYWALLFLVISLAVTPFRRIGRYGALLDVRRMIGVGAFAYVAVHIVLYVADLKWDWWKAGSEIVLRLYLTIGFVALLGLTVLAVTSTDGMVRRLGGSRWQRLHQIVYVLTLLALIHFFQQTKADVWLPTLVAGLVGWLMGYRLLIWRKTARGELPTWSLVALAFGVAILTFLAEAVGIGLAFNVSPLRVLEMAFDFDPYSIRPGWFVLAAGLIVAAIDWARARFAKPRRSAARPQPQQAKSSANPV
jgi:sulfoxide reductase heme-binding subunit YedZ